MKAFLSWMIDNYLAEWIVLRADYDEVQKRSWSAFYERERAEGQARRATKEMFDAMDQVYARSIPFARFDDAEISAQVITHFDYSLRSFCYQARVDEARWHSVTDLASFKRAFLERFADNAGHAFKEHVRTQLFKLEPSV